MRNPVKLLTRKRKPEDAPDREREPAAPAGIQNGAQSRGHAVAPEYSVLAEIWDNEDDARYDSL